MYRDTQHRFGSRISMAFSAVVVLQVIGNTCICCSVTAEAAGSSPVVPAILLNGLRRTPQNNLGPFGSNKRSVRADLHFPPPHNSEGTSSRELVDEV